MNLRGLVRFASFAGAAMMLGTSGLQAVETVDLKVYCWDGYVTNEELSKFAREAEKRHGIKINEKYEMITDEAKQYDFARTKSHNIICPSMDLILDDSYKFVEKEIVVPFDSEKMANFKDLAPEFQKPSYAMKDGKIYAMPICTGPVGLYYDANKVPEPKHWNVLWTGDKVPKYGISNLVTHIFASVAVGSGLDPASGFKYDELRTNQAFLDSFQKVVKNAAVYFEGVDAVDTIQGLDYYIAYGFSMRESNATKGTQWRLALPEEGHAAWLDNWVMTKKVLESPMTKQVTQEFIDHMLRPEWQKELILMGVEATNLKAYALMSDKDYEVAPHMKDTKRLRNKRFFAPSYPKRDRNGIFKLYKEAGGKGV